ncbi:MAG TPA: antibiotic biosynthesis monooxygenase family protein [Steroidobacteraceae bacterium]|nr:antibiotic biosynthesis monooxygenase family protein [Steroidobacteraceae bacterium]
MLLAAACSLIGGSRVAVAQGAAAANSDGPIILIGQMTVKAGHEQDFIKLVAQMKARVQSEDHGNIRYELFKVAPRPGQAAGASDGRNFFFLEEWRDQAAAAAHGKWAGPIVRTQWRALTDSMQLVLVHRLPLQ